MTDEQAERLIAAVMAQTTLLSRLLAQLPQPRQRRTAEQYHQPTRAEIVEAEHMVARRRRRSHH